jgi:hypothetical protein
VVPLTRAADLPISSSRRRQVGGHFLRLTPALRKSRPRRRVWRYWLQSRWVFQFLRKFPALSLEECSTQRIILFGRKCPLTPICFVARIGVHTCAVRLDRDEFEQAIQSQVLSPSGPQGATVRGALANQGNGQEKGMFKRFKTNNAESAASRPSPHSRLLASEQSIW